MVNLLRFIAVTAALATTPATAAGPPAESLLATASHLGQTALTDPAAYDFVKSLTTAILPVSDPGAAAKRSS